MPESLTQSPPRRQHPEYPNALEVFEPTRSPSTLRDPVKRELSLLVSQVREAERLSLARELHDGPVQELIAFCFSLAALRRRLAEPDVEPVLELERDLVGIVRGLRSLVTELRSPTVQEFSLNASIEGMVAKLLHENPATAVRVAIALSEIDELSHLQKLCLLRTVQEALHNCLRHARARNITVSLKQVGRQAQLTVEDDGRGFVVPADINDLLRSGHYGLAGMSERAQLHQGALRVHSRPGSGTRIQLSLELHGCELEP